GIGENQTKYYNTAAEMDEFFRVVPLLEPFLYTIGLRIRRTMTIPTIGPVALEAVLPTTRRNSPALALFVGTEKEWVFWTPRGYYDTSIEGDSRYLGWHINAEFGSTRPTDFVPIGAYAGTMLRPRVLDRLWRTGDLSRALEQEGLPPAAAQPERR